MSEEMEAQLNKWRGKLDELRVQASLLKMESRDKHAEVVAELESAYETAKGKLAEATAAGEAETSHVKAGLSAAMSAFQSAYKAHTEDGGGEESGGEAEAASDDA